MLQSPADPNTASRFPGFLVALTLATVIALLPELGALRTALTGAPQSVAASDFRHA